MNSHPPTPFSHYDPSSQRQPQRPLQNPEQSRIPAPSQQEPQILQHQQQFQYQQSQYVAHPSSAYMAMPIQPPNPSAGFYAHQQSDMQNRLAHLQLQHPQQSSRPGRGTPSPTRSGFPPGQQLVPNSGRVTITRSTAGFSRSMLDQADATRVKIEHLYKISVEQAVERNQRYCRAKN